MVNKNHKLLYACCFLTFYIIFLRMAWLLSTYDIFLSSELASPSLNETQSLFFIGQFTVFLNSRLKFLSNLCGTFFYLFTAVCWKTQCPEISFSLCKIKIWNPQIQVFGNFETCVQFVLDRCASRSLQGDSWINGLETLNTDATRSVHGIVNVISTNALAKTFRECCALCLGSVGLRYECTADINYCPLLSSCIRHVHS